MRHVFDPWIGKIPWSRKCQPIPVLLPGKSQGQRSMVGSYMGGKELDMTKWLNNILDKYDALVPLILKSYLEIILKLSGFIQYQ